jgi:hypothetical protein
MDITINKVNNTVTWGALEIGVLFVYKDLLYIKTAKGIQKGLSNSLIIGTQKTYILGGDFLEGTIVLPVLSITASV